MLEAVKSAFSDLDIGGPIRTILRLFKLDNAPLEGECVSMSKNPKLIEVYATKQRKNNTKNAIEVSDPPEKRMLRPKILKSQRGR
ncbi:12968_t:CDS:2 [Gigaspora margarita]|uniref:12968_t:CDS:1 n=1 Tax=Gigaspora margarita TaxID=4874 RepID=A0ABN7UCB5_GIGMA|nr:12968_t:CDS:2 [Gigaspora margarita]